MESAEEPGTDPGKDLVKGRLEAPVHGGGLIKRGQPPGVRQGGPTPNVIKQAARKDLAAVLPLLRLIVEKGKANQKAPKNLRHLLEDGETVSMKDRTRAMELLAKIGMDQNVSLTDVRAMLVATRTELAEFLPKEQFDTIWPRIMGHWVKL